jgi:hypothetical protein
LAAEAAAAAATAIVTEAVAKPWPKDEDSREVRGSTMSDLCARKIRLCVEGVDRDRGGSGIRAQAFYLIRPKAQSFHLFSKAKPDLNPA